MSMHTYAHVLSRSDISYVENCQAHEDNEYQFK